jgi:hypothetical protein
MKVTLKEKCYINNGLQTLRIHDITTSLITTNPIAGPQTHGLFNFKIDYNVLGLNRAYGNYSEERGSKWKTVAKQIVQSFTRMCTDLSNVAQKHVSKYSR